MLLKHEQVGYKPFQYPFAFDFWKAQQKMHWLPEEVPMTNDVFDFNHLLTQDERDIVTDVLRFFTQGDIDVGDCYIKNYLSFFKPVEVRMMLTAFANMETIHTQAYSHLVDTLGLPESSYNEFMNIKIMKEKHSLGCRSFKSDRELLKGMACYGGFIEGLQLFGSFSVLMNFQRFGLLKGLGQIVTWSVRDESLHSEGIIKLYHELKNEVKLDDELISEIILECRNLLNIEFEFLDYIFRDGREIRGVTIKDLKEYLRYIYHMRMDMLELKDNEISKGSSLDYMEDSLNSLEYANFFVSKSTEYTKCSMTGEWEY